MKERKDDVKGAEMDALRDPHTTIHVLSREESMQEQVKEKNWRPEGWKNPYPKDIYGLELQDDILTTVVAEITYDAYESGADAMREEICDLFLKGEKIPVVSEENPFNSNSEKQAERLCWAAYELGKKEQRDADLSYIQQEGQRVANKIFEEIEKHKTTGGMTKRFDKFCIVMTDRQLSILKNKQR